MAAGSITFSPARQIRPGSTCMHDRRKKKKKEEEEEPIARLKQREKLRSKGKSCTKTNSCNPKVTVTDLRWPVWTGGSRSFAVFKQWKGEFIGDGTNHLVKAICIGFRNRAFPTGSSWRHQATSPSNRRRSTAGELPAPLSAAALLDDDHFSDVKKKLAIALNSQTKWRRLKESSGFARSSPHPRAGLLIHCALSRSLVKIRLQDTSLPHFS